MKILLVFLLCFGLVRCNVINQTDDRLIFAQVIFRHGDRTVRSTYPNDPYKDEKVHWPQGFSQLTNLGKQQQYELGKYFRRRYAKLLGDGSYSPDKVFTVSSDTDRTINSASLVLAGLFPPQTHQIWNEQLPWQPIPVHIVPRSSDYLIIVEKICPRFERALEEYQKLPEMQALLKKNRELFEYLELHAGQPIRSIEHLKDLHATLEVEHHMNKTLPSWTQGLFTEGEFVYLAEYWLILTTSTTEMKRLKSGFLLKEILDRFKNKTISILSPDRSLWIYSAHDITIAAMLNSLGLFELHIPPYSSSLLFELYESNDDNFYVQLFYRNSTTAENPAPLNIPDCGTKCPLDKFYDLYSEILPSDYETECQLSKN